MPGRGGMTALDDLPESIVVEEILVRLPPKDLVRCRAVRKCWHSATSTDKFILDHRRRQPLLPILCHVLEQRLCPVIRSCGIGILQAALDGLLILCHERVFIICNPVTRKCAPLGKPQFQLGFYDHIIGFYRHQPSGDYRVLWGSSPTHWNAFDTNYQTFYYAIPVGSDNARLFRRGCVPRPVVSSPSLDMALRQGLPSSSGYPPVHHRGNLHWKLGACSGVDDGYIVVFNTAAESFRLMRRPTHLRPLDLWLLDMDGTLALCSISSDQDTIDVWVIQDYHAETWSFKHRIILSGADPPPPVDTTVTMFPNLAVLNEGELLFQFTRGCVLRYDIDGKFLGYVKDEEDQEINLWLTKHYLQKSVITLPIFHEMRAEAVVIPEPPFFVGL